MIGFQIKAITSRPDLAGFIQPSTTVVIFVLDEISVLRPDERAARATMQ